MDCTFSTPPRPSISEAAIQLIQALLKKEPHTRLTIDQIIAHPWLNECEELSFDEIANATKLPSVPKNVKTSVHNQVIDQMVIKGVGNSKEHIEKVLESVRAIEEETYVDDKSTHNNGSNAEPALSGDKSRGVNHEHYIKATYQLLKDKSLREFHGLHQNNSVSTKVTGHLPKRLLPLRPRKHLIQQISKNTKPFQEEEVEDDNPITFTAPIATQLELPNDDGTGFTLPLQRKCSIVSEEGSCAAEGNGSDLSSLEGPIGDRLIHEEQKPSLPIVNIVVTDYSENDALQEDEEEALYSNMYENECDIDVGPKDWETTVGYTDTCVEANTKSDTVDHLNKGPVMATTQSTLHSVSSSPELLRNAEMEEMADNNYDVCVSGSQTSRGRPPTMILSNETKHDKKSDRLISHFGTNVSTNNSTNNSNSPSMRIIVQSKSCNNILFNDNGSPISETKSETKKSSNSVCMKKHKNDRTDCCIIC